MTSDKGNDTADLIPHGTEVTCRLVGGERYVCGTPGRPTLYRLLFGVTDGPHAGKELERTLWDTERGRRQMRKDLEKLGVGDPDLLCRAPVPEVLVRARVGIEQGRGSPINTVTWFDPLSERRPEERRPDAGYDAERLDGAF